MLAPSPDSPQAAPAASLAMRPPLEVRFRHDAALAASLDRALAARPERGQDHGDVWLFVYGLLADDPPQEATDRAAVRLPGRRAFTLYDVLNRGSAAQPGLVLGLEPPEGGEVCEGLAYRLPAGARGRRALMAVWRQEMRMPAYVPRWRQARRADGEALAVLAFESDPSSPLHRPAMPWDEQVARLMACRGSAGSNLDYLGRVTEAFAAAGIRDPYLDHLGEAVRRPEAA